MIPKIIFINKCFVCVYIVIIVVMKKVNKGIVWFHVFCCLTLLVDSVKYSIALFEIDSLMHVFFKLMKNIFKFSETQLELLLFKHFFITHLLDFILSIFIIILFAIVSFFSFLLFRFFNLHIELLDFLIHVIVCKSRFKQGVCYVMIRYLGFL